MERTHCEAAPCFPIKSVGGPIPQSPNWFNIARAQISYSRRYPLSAASGGAGADLNAPAAGASNGSWGRRLADASRANSGRRTRSYAGSARYPEGCYGCGYRRRCGVSRLETFRNRRTGRKSHWRRHSGRNDSPDEEKYRGPEAGKRRTRSWNAHRSETAVKIARPRIDGGRVSRIFRTGHHDAAHSGGAKAGRPCRSRRIS